MTDLLTVKDVAKILGLSTNTVYKYVNSGVIRSSRAQLKQGRFRVPKTAVDEFLGAALDEITQTSTQAVQSDTAEQPIDVLEVVTETETTVDAQNTQDTNSHNSDKVDQLLHSLVHNSDGTASSEDNTTAKTNLQDNKEQLDSTTSGKEVPTTQASPDSDKHTSVLPPPSFAMQLTRVLLLLGLVLFVVNLAYFSAPHPIALFSQLSILFVFMLLSYQYGGMKRRTA